ncbi:hypothetical protein EIN_494210 [Entamoeba invadens IP1]|uniref:DDE-1 domain-containing protein n=1 Tax=Entamoeba invadens IP1 TaxID=370355 RepID=A0A0A1TX60_ENTIV|nr:hypothetical protein EIN_494210 [Entamoeba invadens IP1]ELP83975.1 hypothetical protein EIN_494210 [Entamoeba invadens IP1]|eukprot:XP_004183321.1 hypothetical protein EIN_494210 [Entamoeba invadens IP1]
MDGLGSHFSEEASKWFTDNHVAVLKLFPHSLHITQPLDVSVFGVQKLFDEDLNFEPIDLQSLDHVLGTLNLEDTNCAKGKKKDIIRDLYEGRFTKADLVEFTRSPLSNQIISIYASWDKATSGVTIVNTFRKCGFFNTRCVKGGETCLRVKFFPERPKLMMTFLGEPVLFER